MRAWTFDEKCTIQYSEAGGACNSDLNNEEAPISKFSFRDSWKHPGATPIAFAAVSYFAFVATALAAGPPRPAYLDPLVLNYGRKRFGRALPGSSTKPNPHFYKIIEAICSGHHRKVSQMGEPSKLTRWCDRISCCQFGYVES